MYVGLFFIRITEKKTTKEERMSEQYHLGTSVVYTAVVSFQKAGEISSILFSSDGKKRGYALV